ncbi:hypothetical protein H5410_047119 [Solanum commersonii]|uniref:Uncharacterized protein n=1 Tax=Solanum commersonii TaxID=4109 RepID=A0A9J5XG67_SOLCO|nr:hypothetical protein H5410_047119 [Solanum commersonii]
MASTTVNVTDVKKRKIEHLSSGEKNIQAWKTNVFELFCTLFKTSPLQLTNINRIYLSLYLFSMNLIQSLDTLSFIVLNCSWNTLLWCWKQSFLHSFVAATECCVLQDFDFAMWMPYVPVLLWKLNIFSPVIAS